MSLREKIERVAIIGAEPAYTPYGYLIAEDALIYSLTQKWVHGVILALLYPNVAAEAGYSQPDVDDLQVFHYQKFELDNHEKFPVIRISLGMMYPFNISKGDAPASVAQRQALVKILKCQDMSMQSMIQTDLHEMSARQYLKQLENEHGH